MAEKTTMADKTVMTAIVQDTYGSADVLELRDIGKPVIAVHEVLVRMHAARVDRGRVAPDDRVCPARSASRAPGTQDPGSGHGQGGGRGRSRQRGNPVPVPGPLASLGGLDAVAIAAAVFVLDDIPGRGRVGDNAVDAALGDAQAGRDVAQPGARVEGDAQQDPGMVGQETPALHTS